MEVLHLLAAAAVITAGRLVYVRLRPVRTCGRCEGRGCKRCRDGHVFRFGAKWTARAHLALQRAIDEWRKS